MVDDKAVNYLLINNGIFASIECTNNKGYKNNYAGCYFMPPVNYTETFTA